MKHINTSLILTVILSFYCNMSFAESPLSFKQPWIAEAPPVSKVLAAYMEITNSSDKPIVIDSMSSEDFKKIEFHRTVQENDMARMLHQKSLSIPASGSLKLEPGSYHLMLFNPTRRLLAGDKSTIIAKTDDDLVYAFVVTVKKSNSDHQHHHHHNH